MPRHEQVPHPMKTALALLAGAIMAPGLARAQPIAPAAAPQAPAMVQAPTAPVPPTAPIAALPTSAAAPGPASDTLGTAPFQSKVGREKAAKIERQIARLHAALRITPEQEPVWQNLASAMRQNVVQLDAVYARREHQFGTMNAVQDLQSYAEVQEANAHNVQMLLPPFQALYDRLSPEQRKAADATFQHNTNRALQKSG